MNITVYLGANLGTDPALPQAVQQLGRWIGESGNALVYGGSKSGLMGLLADSVLAAGGRVTGVEPKCFLDAELQHEGLTELIVTEDIPSRKTKMIELGDAFIAFPGGTGALEEITEVISKLSLGQLDAPCILYDLNGYYQPLHQLLQQMITMGLSTPARQRSAAHWTTRVCRTRCCPAFPVCNYWPRHWAARGRAGGSSPHMAVPVTRWPPAAQAGQPFS